MRLTSERRKGPKLVPDLCTVIASPSPQVGLAGESSQSRAAEEPTCGRGPIEHGDTFSAKTCRSSPEPGWKEES